MSRILIIEDDEDLREGLAFSLEMDGCETACAGTKREGMEQLKKSRYDLVLLDCNLPDGSGYDLCTEIRECGDMPLFMLTARNTEMDEVKALELGAADFMSKPFSLAVLKFVSCGEPEPGACQRTDPLPCVGQPGKVCG